MPNRLTLAIDTALGHCAAALVQGEDVCAAAADPVLTGHTERLAPMVADLFRSSGLTPADVQRVAVTTGPGSFTGIRTGLAFARSFARARNVPVVGLSSLSSLALGYPGDVTVCIDGRASVYVQRMLDAHAACEPEVVSSDHLATALKGTQTIVAYNLPDLSVLCPGARVVNLAGADPVALARWGAAADPEAYPAFAHYMRDAGARLPAMPS